MNDEALVADPSRNVSEGKPVAYTQAMKHADTGSLATDQREEGNEGRTRTAGASDSDRDGSTARKEESNSAVPNFWSWIDPTLSNDPSAAAPMKEERIEAAAQGDERSPEVTIDFSPMNSVWSSMVAWIDPEPDLDSLNISEAQEDPPAIETAEDKVSQVHDDDDEDEDSGSKLLGGDLKSLPSVKTEPDYAEPSLNSKDINIEDASKNDASAVESTARALDLPADESVKTNPSAKSGRSSKSARSTKSGHSTKSGPSAKSLSKVKGTKASTDAVVLDKEEARDAEPEVRENVEEKQEDRSSKKSARKGLTAKASKKSPATPSSSKKKGLRGDKKLEGSIETRRNLLVKELRQAVATYGRYDIRCANISSALGDLLFETGQQEQAIKLHKDAVTIYSCKLGDDHTTTTNAKIRLGAVLENAGLYDEAINTYYIATSMRRSLNGDEDPSVADGYILMAHALRKKADYPQAIKELKRALKIYREALGDAHEKVSNTVDEIASLYVTLGDFEKSAAILEEVVKLKAATLGPGDRAVAVTLSSLATTYECSSQFDKAMTSLKKAYKIYTDLGGFSSEEATNVLNRMALLYEATNDHNRAAIAYLGVLRGRKALHGASDLSIGETYYKLGRALRKTGQLDKALKCMKEALPIYVNTASEVEEANMIAEIMREMALINKEKNNHADAARIFKQELGVRRKLGQPDYPLIARTLNHLGVAEYESGNSTRALKYLVEALTIFQGEGEESLDCAEVLFNTGLVFEAVRNTQRAVEAFSEAARIFSDRGYDEDHPHLAKANYKIQKLQSAKKSRGRKESGSGRKRLFK